LRRASDVPASEPINDNKALMDELGAALGGHPPANPPVKRWP
jgi:hypothetical protein